MSNKEISTLRDFSSFFNMENIRSICTLKKSRGISNVMYKVRHNKSRIKKKTRFDINVYNRASFYYNKEVVYTTKQRSTDCKTCWVIFLLLLYTRYGTYSSWEKNRFNANISIKKKPPISDLINVSRFILNDRVMYVKNHCLSSFFEVRHVNHINICLP